MFVYDPATNTVEERGEIVPGLGGEVRPLAVGPDGRSPELNAVSLSAAETELPAETKAIEERRCDTGCRRPRRHRERTSRRPSDRHSEFRQRSVGVIPPEMPQ